jgi:hypothetical protein
MRQTAAAYRLLTIPTARAQRTERSRCCLIRALASPSERPALVRVRPARGNRMLNKRRAETPLLDAGRTGHLAKLDQLPVHPQQRPVWAFPQDAPRALAESFFS